MIVIIKNISESTIVPDIELFINPILQGGFLKKVGRIESIKIQMLQLIGSNHVEYNASVKIEPDAAAERVIKTLNRKLCNNRLVNVSEFHVRHYQNDRRKNRYQRLDTRRKADRRRKLEVKDITAERRESRLNYKLLQMESVKKSV